MALLRTFEETLHVKGSAQRADGRMRRDDSTQCTAWSAAHGGGRWL